VAETPVIASPHRMELVDNIVASMNYTALLFKDLGTLIILAILQMIPLVNLIVTGYIRRVIHESPESEVLPLLKDFSRLWIDGFKLWLVTFVYMLIPSLIITAASAGLILGAMRFHAIRRAGVVPRLVPLDFAEFFARNLAIYLRNQELNIFVAENL